MLASVLLIGSAVAYKEEENVVVLDSSTFDDFIRAEALTLVEFCALRPTAPCADSDCC